MQYPYLFFGDYQSNNKLQCLIYFVFQLVRLLKKQEIVMLLSILISTIIDVTIIIIAVVGLVPKVDAVEGHAPEYPFSHSITTFKCF